MKVKLLLTIIIGLATRQLLAYPNYITNNNKLSKAILQTNCSTGFQSPQILATLEDLDINESSGIVASRLNPNLYWTHNDSGDGPFIYAFDTKGKKRGVWKVANATAIDWEDIAIGPGPKPNKSYLYLADIGDNNRVRPYIVVYQFLEPKITNNNSSVAKSNASLTKKSNAIKLRYPDGKYDAEVLLIHPKTGQLYIITKTPFPNPTSQLSRIYKATPPFSTKDINTLSFVTELHLPEPVSFFSNRLTGGDISSDGQQVVLCDYQRGYELCLPSEETNFDNIWKQPLSSIELNTRIQGEGICYRLDGKALLTTSEGTTPPLGEIIRK
jgi:hypothetical protein